MTDFLEGFGQIAVPKVSVRAALPGPGDPNPGRVGAGAVVAGLDR